MAGDWIKMRASLTTDPKVARIGEALEKSAWFSRWLTMDQHEDVTLARNALRYAVTGALHAIWCAANEHARDGFVAGANSTWVDDVCGVPEFGAAMLSVGWLEVSANGIRFPKFDVNNTSGADRQKRYREKKRDETVTGVTSPVTSPVTTRVEKRREEEIREEKEDKDNAPAKPAARAVYDPDFEVWWKVYPRHEGKPAAAKEFKMAVKGLALLPEHGERDKALEWLLMRTRAYADSPAGKRTQYVPHPERWLKHRRFEDDEREWQRAEDRGKPERMLGPGQQYTPAAGDDPHRAF